MSEPLTVDHFRDAVDEPFTAEADGAGAVELVLAEARGLGRTFQDREAFVLMFRGPQEPFLPQATYRLTHAGVGAHEIFIVPVARSDAGYDYEANFV